MSRATQDDGSGDLSERDVPSYRKYLFIQTRHQKMEFKSLTNIESSFKRIRLLLAVLPAAVRSLPDMRCGAHTALPRSNARKSMCLTGANR